MRLTHFPFHSIEPARLSHQFQLRNILNNYAHMSEEHRPKWLAWNECREWTLCMSTETHIFFGFISVAFALRIKHRIVSVCKQCVCYNEGDMDSHALPLSCATHANDCQIERLRHFSMSFLLLLLLFYLVFSQSIKRFHDRMRPASNRNLNGNQTQWNSIWSSSRWNITGPGNTTPCQIECLEIKITTFCVTSQHSFCAIKIWFL